MYKNWRDLIKPKKLQVETESFTNTYGKFFAEPFERGFGTTLGNSLRRALLSSLQGAAITSVKIKGVLHEFSSIPGVKEDVTDIILNLKGVRLKMHGNEPRFIRIVHKGEGIVRAGDIDHRSQRRDSESRPSYRDLLQGCQSGDGDGCQNGERVCSC